MGLSVKFRKEYNKQLARYYKAEEFLNNASEEVFDKWYPNFDEIVRWLGKQIEIAEKFNYTMSDKEILEGFKEV